MNASNGTHTLRRRGGAPEALPEYPEGIPGPGALEEGDLATLWGHRSRLGYSEFRGGGPTENMATPIRGIQEDRAIKPDRRRDVAKLDQLSGNQYPSDRRNESRNSKGASTDLRAGDAPRGSGRNNPGPPSEVSTVSAPVDKVAEEERQSQGEEAVELGNGQAGPSSQTALSADPKVGRQDHDA